MPDGRKYPGGASKLRARRAADARAAAGRSTKLAAVWLTQYAELGAPPVDAVGRVAWANHACAMLLHETLNDPGLEPRERRRLGAELIRTLGMTGVKALYEERLKKLEGKVYGVEKHEADDDGTEPLAPETP